MLLPPVTDSQLPTAAQLKLFIDSAGPSLRRIALFLLNCDANVSETLLLEWQQIDLAGGQIRFGDRVTTIVDRVRQMLACVPPHERIGRVFRDPRNRPYAVDPNRGGNLKTAFREAYLRAGVPPISARTLIRIRKGRELLASLEKVYGRAA